MKPKWIYQANGEPAERLSDVIEPADISSFVGGGGKTSSMLAFGTELAQAGNRVIMTTTTHILPVAETLTEGLSCVGELLPSGKLGAVPAPDRLKEQCDILLIEADGSRGLPVKAPAEHEPVLTEGTELVVAVVGLSGVGKRICDTCHRPERVCSVLGAAPERTLTPDMIVKLLLSEQGSRKGVGKRRFAVILNQADSAVELEKGFAIARKLPQTIACAITAYQRTTDKKDRKLGKNK